MKLAIDCLNKIMIDSIISPYKTSELSLAKENIKEALEYFNISESDWIEYGDAVINMKNIDFDPNIQHIGNLNPLDIWLENDSIELVRYRDFKSNDYKKSDTI